MRTFLGHCDIHPHFFFTFRSGDVGDALVCSDTAFAYVLLGLIADICF